ncbi:quinate-4 [Paramyrothecium foliicola]|nr:quinate-4 [Paramyrothecium foliicola]
MSLGHCSAGHPLMKKLEAAHSYGYQGIELCYEDLLDVAGRTSDDPSPGLPCPPPDLAAAASKIRSWCEEKEIKILCLQPFMQYEGLLDRREHQSKFEELLTWIELARVLGTDLIMVPASSLPKDKASGDLDVIARDFQRAADAARRETPHIRFAYESRCSATYIDKWEFCWEVVQRVDRSNFGMCLDTFHLASTLYGDPTVPSGRALDGEKAVRLSMVRLVKRLKPFSYKVFHVQIGDARLPDEPINPTNPDYDINQSPQTIWSQKYRLFYREVGRGAYLPITEIADAIFNGLGYEGWVSLELFNRRMDCGEPIVPTELARRGAISWDRLASDMGWWPLS